MPIGESREDRRLGQDSAEALAFMAHWNKLEPLRVASIYAVLALHHLVRHDKVRVDEIAEGKVAAD